MGTKWIYVYIIETIIETIIEIMGEKDVMVNCLAENISKK